MPTSQLLQFMLGKQGSTNPYDFGDLYDLLVGRSAESHNLAQTLKVQLHAMRYTPHAVLLQC